MALQENDRAKLDGIVSQMQANNEPDSNIQFVVNDFKQKYDNPSFMSRLGSGIKNLTGQMFPRTAAATNPMQTAAAVPEDIVSGVGKAISDIPGVSQLGDAETGLNKKVAGVMNSMDGGNRTYPAENIVNDVQQLPLVRTLPPGILQTIGRMSTQPSTYAAAVLKIPFLANTITKISKDLEQGAAVTESGLTGKSVNALKTASTPAGGQSIIDAGKAQSGAGGRLADDVLNLSKATNSSNPTVDAALQQIGNTDGITPAIKAYEDAKIKPSGPNSVLVDADRVGNAKIDRRIQALKGTASTPEEILAADHPGNFQISQADRDAAVAESNQLKAVVQGTSKSANQSTRNSDLLAKKYMAARSEIAPAKQAIQDATDYYDPGAEADTYAHGGIAPSKYSTEYDPLEHSWDESPEAAKANLAATVKASKDAFAQAQDAAQTAIAKRAVGKLSQADADAAIAKASKAQNDLHVADATAQLANGTDQIAVAKNLVKNYGISEEDLPGILKQAGQRSQITAKPIDYSMPATDLRNLRIRMDQQIPFDEEGGTLLSNADKSARQAIADHLENAADATGNKTYAPAMKAWHDQFELLSELKGQLGKMKEVGDDEAGTSNSVRAGRLLARAAKEQPGGPLRELLGKVYATTGKDHLGEADLANMADEFTGTGKGGKVLNINQIGKPSWKPNIVTTGEAAGGAFLGSHILPASIAYPIGAAAAIASSPAVATKAVIPAARNLSFFLRSIAKKGPIMSAANASQGDQQ